MIAGSRFEFKVCLLKAFVVACLLFVCSCSTRNVSSHERPFSFDHDTLAYRNDLTWEYFYDTNGKWRSKRREPAPDYTQHCFVVARSARQFFNHARFDATLPKANDTQYEQLVHTVLSRSFTKASLQANKVIIPGYGDLREFSRDHETLFKQQCGHAWHSYVQRGHWRMLLPFSGHGQEKMALTLATKINGNEAPVIHLVRFPQLTINHAALLYGVNEKAETIEFAMYDPNYPEKPATLTFDKRSKQFILPANTYFPGGKVNVYEIYKSPVL